MKKRKRYRKRKVVLCPVCRIPFERKRYEGVPVWRCARCHGYFVHRYAAEGIRRNKRYPSEAVALEAEEYRGPGPLAAKHRCPRCRAAMRTESFSGFMPIRVDVCPDCDHLWFDAGELALFQLGFEYSRKGLQADELQQRIRELDPKLRARFKRRLRARSSRLLCPQGSGGLAKIGRRILRLLRRPIAPRFLP